MIEPVFGALKVPADIEKRKPFLGVFGKKFQAPKYIDLRGYCTEPRQQGPLPICAAASASSMCENILWRKNGYIDHFDMHDVYKYAKKHDGDPTGDGTTLNAALEYFLNKGLFVKEAEIQYIYGGDVYDKVVRGIHCFGVVHIGMNCTSEWMECNPNKTSITANGKYDICGGHAVCAVAALPEGIVIQNSWGPEWGRKSFAIITPKAFREQFIYGCVISHALDGFRMNV